MNDETRLQQAILGALEQLGGVMVWRQNVGRRGGVQFGFSGCSDILAVVAPKGRFVALEVKLPGKRPTPAQEMFLARVKALGGVGLVVHDVKGAVTAVMAARSK